MENFRANVREEATNIGRWEAAERRENEHRFMKTLWGLTGADDDCPGEFREIQLTEKVLRSKLDQRYWGAILCSHERKVRFEAQKYKQFWHFERERITRKTMNDVTHSREISQGREEVVTAFGDYYK